MKVNTKRVFLSVIISFLAFNFGNLYAQPSNAYPEKAITIIVPYPPGGFNDTLGRIVGKKLADAWGVNVIV